MQAQRDVGAAGGIGGGLLDRHLLERDLLAAAAAHRLVRHHRVVEVQRRQLLQAVAVAGAVEHVGQQHGVVVGRDLEPVAGEHALIVLQVVPDLEHGRVLEHRAQALQHLAARQLAGRERAEIVPVRERHVAGLALLDREREADQLGARDVGRGGRAVEREDAPGGRAIEPGIEAREVVHGGVFGGARRLLASGAGALAWLCGERLDPLGERPEAVPAGELQQPRIVERAGVQLLERGERRHRVAQGDQPLRHARLLGVLEQVLAALGLPDRGRVGEQAFQIAELLQQLRRGLDPDPRHAGHVVGGVAGERQHVAHQLRPDPEARDHLGAVDRLSASSGRTSARPGGSAASGPCPRRR